jgi:hypothetical protein
MRFTSHALIVKRDSVGVKRRFNPARSLRGFGFQHQRVVRSSGTGLPVDFVTMLAVFGTRYAAGV